MDIGTVFPQTEIGHDPEMLKKYGRTVDAASFDHVLSYDHVLGVNPDREEWVVPQAVDPYDYTDTFHEPFTTFTYLAGVTDDLDFVTGILVLPQRQTVLVAKQAAQLDLVSGGSFRMGVGLGWNGPEYVGLGKDFRRRGPRLDEQVTLLRELWTNELVDFSGEFHTVPDAGIRPLPVQQPIPIWMGGMSDPMKRRIARSADGWIPMFQPGEEAERHLANLYEYAEGEGRDPEEIGLHGIMYAVPGEEDDLIKRVQGWWDLGADYLSLNTMSQGLKGEEHTQFLEDTASVLAETGLL